MTGFDAPSVSTIYLDRPMRNHTLMQTIARANRVFPEKDNGLIVDYVGVFRNLEKALAIYGAANAEAGVDSPIQDIDALVGRLEAAIDTVVGLCAAARRRPDRAARRERASSTSRCATPPSRRCSSTRRPAPTFLAAARQVRKLFKALLPDPAPAAQQRTVAAIRVLAERIADVSRPPAADLDGDRRRRRRAARPLGRRRGVRHPGRRRGQRTRPAHRPVPDRLRRARRHVRRPQARRDRPARRAARSSAPSQRGSPEPDPLRPGRADRGADRRVQRRQPQHRRVPAPAHRALEDAHRGGAAGRQPKDLTEEELAIFDLLTKPEPVLTDDERELVKASAKRLLAHLHDKLVLDWRRKAATTADVRATIRDVLDAELPADPYPPEVFDAKVQAVFDHVAHRLRRRRHQRLRRRRRVEPATTAVLESRSCHEPRPRVASPTRSSSGSARRRVRRARRRQARTCPAEPALRTIEELIDNDEDYAVEFKSTARWDLREDKPNKAMEDAVVKTVAGFLNTDGGTLLIGVDNSGHCSRARP